MTPALRLPHVPTARVRTANSSQVTAARLRTESSFSRRAHCHHRRPRNRFCRAVADELAAGLASSSNARSKRRLADRGGSRELSRQRPDVHAHFSRGRMTGGLTLTDRRSRSVPQPSPQRMPFRACPPPRRGPLAPWTADAAAASAPPPCRRRRRACRFRPRPRRAA
jgi:hypothetical protein